MPTNSDNVTAWKSTGLSEESVKPPPATLDKS